jgi:putative transposase
MSEGKAKGINRELRNASISQFVQFLSYKTQKLIFVNPYNTSKTCNHCGKIHDLKLSDRTISCSCGSIYDRDVNAAKNILCLGQAMIAKQSCIENLTLQKILAKNKNSSPK